MALNGAGVSEPGKSLAVHPVGRAAAEEMTVVGMVFDLEQRLQGAKLQHSAFFVPSHIYRVGSA